MTRRRLRARRLTGWSVLLAMALGQVAHGQFADLETVKAPSQENVLDKTLARWMALKGRRVQIVLTDRSRITGRLVDVTADTVTLLRDESGAVYRVRRAAIDDVPVEELVEAPSLVGVIDDLAQRTAHGRIANARAYGRLQAITDDLAARAQRKVTAGIVLTVIGAVGIALNAILLIEFAGVDRGDLGSLVTNPDQSAISVLILFGVIAGAALAAIGIPVLIVGRYEQRMVERLLHPRVVMSPLAPLSPSGFANPLGGALSLSFDF